MDIGNKPNFIEHRPSCSSLSITDNKIHLNNKITFKNLEKSTRITNYKIEGEYFDDIEWKMIDILIDTGVASSYISKCLTFMLELEDLTKPVNYINFNGEEFRVTKFCTVIIRLSNQEMQLPSMAEDEGKNDTISIMLGMTFLEKCNPWRITSHNLVITIDNKEIIIPK